MLTEKEITATQKLLEPMGWEEPDINEGADPAAITAVPDTFRDEFRELTLSERDMVVLMSLDAENDGSRDDEVAMRRRFGTIRARVLMAHGHGTTPEEVA